MIAVQILTYKHTLPTTPIFTGHRSRVINSVSIYALLEGLNYNILLRYCFSDSLFLMPSFNNFRRRDNFASNFLTKRILY
jgi:hypothetical protein